MPRVVRGEERRLVHFADGPLEPLDRGDLLDHVGDWQFATVRQLPCRAVPMQPGACLAIKVFAAFGSFDFGQRAGQDRLLVRYVFLRYRPASDFDPGQNGAEKRKSLKTAAAVCSYFVLDRSGSNCYKTRTLS